LKGPGVAENNKSSRLFYLLLPVAAFLPCWARNRCYFHDDLVMQYSHFRTFLADQILHGRFPLWDPYLLGGIPFFADPNAMAAYPLLYPTLLFPTVWGLNLFFMAHAALAAFGMDFLLRAFSLTPQARRAGAATFALSGFFWNEVVHPPILAAFCWLPWIFGFLERLAREGPRPRLCFGAGLASSLLFLSGNYQMSLTAFYGGVFFFILRKAAGGMERPPEAGWFRGTAWFLWGAFPLFLWLIPSLEWILHSTRFHDSWDYKSFNADFSVEPSFIWRFLFPLNPMGRVFLPYRDYLDNAGYLGIWAPILAAAGFRRGLRRGLPWVFLALGGLAMALGSHLPLHFWACRWLPGLRYLRSPVRFLCLYALGGSFLVAEGYETVRESAFFHRVRGALPFLFFTPLLAAAWTVWTPGPPSNFQVAPRMPFLPELRKELGTERVLIQGDRIPYETLAGSRRYWARFPEDSACVLPLHAANGYNPLQLREYGEITALPFGTFCRLMAVGGILTGEGGFSGGGFREQDWPPFRFLKGGKAPLVWAVSDWRVLDRGDAELAAMGAPGFDPYRTACLSAPLGGEAAGAENSKGAVEWEETADFPGGERFRVRLRHKSLVLFSEVMYPGWRAWMDGSPAPIHTADRLLRALVIPAGWHTIRFSYRPWWEGVLGVLALFWVLASLGAWGFAAKSGFDPRSFFR
jgi:hypothetical protein